MHGRSEEHKRSILLSLGTTKRNPVFLSELPNFFSEERRKLSLCRLCVSDKVDLLACSILFDRIVIKSAPLSNVVKQGWCSGESTRQPPMWPGIDSRFDTTCGLSLLVHYTAMRGFPLGFPLSSKTNILICCDFS